MVFKFMVLNRSGVGYIQIKEMNHAFISIIDPGSEEIKLRTNPFTMGVLRMAFHDLDKPIVGYDLFSKEEAKQILDFINSIKNKIDLIIVNCEAGISRSAAVACSLSKILNGEDTWLIKRYNLYNRHIYNTIMSTYQDQQEEK